MNYIKSNMELVNNNTAILAKTAGFDVPCINYICPQGGPFEGNKLNWNVEDAPYPHTSVPEQVELQDWLRETKGIIVLVDVDIDSTTRYHFFVYKDGYEYSSLFDSSKSYDTWEETLELGLEHALKLKGI